MSTVRLFALFGILVTLLAVIAVLGAADFALDGDSLPPLPQRQDLIAYVDLSGQVHMVTPTGSAVAKISPDEGFYTWPAWSPDSRRIAFSGSAPGGDRRSGLALYTYNVGDAQQTVMYVNEPGMGPILPGMPHYPLWAPDGSRMAVIASARRGLTLYLSDRGANVVAEPAVPNAPLYASWSADSRKLLVHGSADHYLINVNGGVEIEGLDILSDSYRVPAWWPKGDRIVVVSEDENERHALFIVDLESGVRTMVDQVPGGVAFLWSPDGESLAVAHSASAGDIIYGGVSLFAPDGTKRDIKIPDDLIAFFWSPDSTKLAYVTPSERRGVLTWKVFSVDEGSWWSLGDFTPSNTQLTLLQFFDQFAYSHSLWSPDSKSLVFSGTMSGVAVSASMGLQPAPQIIVLDVGPDPYAETLANGVSAVWSPR